MKTHGPTGRKALDLTPEELSEISAALTNAFLKAMQTAVDHSYSRQEIKVMAEIDPLDQEVIWNQVYHQVLNENKPMTLGDDSAREALAPQFSDLKQELMHTVNRGTVTDEGMRASSSGLRLESKASSEKHVQGLSRLGSDEEVVSEPEPKKFRWFDKFKGQVKALFARRQPEELETSEEDNRNQSVVNLDSSGVKARKLTVIEEAKLRTLLTKQFLDKMHTRFPGAQNITQEQKEGVWQEVYPSVLNSLKIIPLTEEAAAALKLELNRFKTTLMASVATPKKKVSFAPDPQLVSFKQERMKKVKHSGAQFEQFGEESDEAESDGPVPVESESDEDNAEGLAPWVQQQFSSFFRGSEKPGSNSKESSAINKLEAEMNPVQSVEPTVESQVIPENPGPVTLLSSRPVTPQTAELFRTSSSNTPGVSPRRIISQPMPTPHAALDQMAIYQEYFEGDSCKTRGCEGDLRRLTITINQHDNDYDANNKKQYYIQPSADPQHPGVDFIADLQADGNPDMALILKICEDAANVAIQQYQKQYALEIHGERPPPQVNFDIPENVPEHIRNAMKNVFDTKHKEFPGAFLVDSVIPSVTVRTPKPGGSSSDAKG